MYLLFRFVLERQDLPYGIAATDSISGNVTSLTFDDNLDAGETFSLRVQHAIRGVGGQTATFEDTLCKIWPYY